MISVYLYSELAAEGALMLRDLREICLILVRPCLLSLAANEFMLIM